jgi:hypothetical protein
MGLISRPVEQRAEGDLRATDIRKSGPVARHAGNRPPPEALAKPSLPRNPPLLLPDRGRRDRGLARRGRSENWRAGDQIPGLPCGRECPGESRAAASRAEARDGGRQDHRHGDAHRLADRQCRPPSRQQTLLSGIPGHSSGHHDSRSAACSPAERSRSLGRCRTCVLFSFTIPVV